MTQATAIASTSAGTNVWDVLGDMSNEDWAWLGRSAAALCAGDTIAPDELVASAIARYISGQRTWNTDVDLRTQMWNAMRSILNSWRKGRSRRPECSLEEVLETLGDEDSTDLPTPLSPEDEAAFEQLQRRISEAFVADPVAQEVIAGLAAGMTPEEIQSILDLTPTDYASVRRRIRRHWVKLSATGAMA